MNSTNKEPTMTIENTLGNMSKSALEHVEQCHGSLDGHAATLKQSQKTREQKLKPIAGKITSIGKSIRKLLR